MPGVQLHGDAVVAGDARMNHAARTRNLPLGDQALAAKYKAYLQSPLWKRRRDLVMKRCGGICEGCGTRRATEVHHVTYQHVFRELLFELRGLCDGCHKICHDDQGAEDPLMPALDGGVSPAIRLRQATPQDSRWDLPDHLKTTSRKEREAQNGAPKEGGA
jgi:hypothetical protein